MVIAIGGTGGGSNDESVHTLARAGQVQFHGIGITPGETTALGFAGARPVLLLPAESTRRWRAGSPSAAACWRAAPSA